MDDTAKNLRQPYIDWIGELSELNNSFDWWCCDLPAKNVHNNFLTHVCLISVANAIIPKFSVPTLVVCSNNILLKLLAHHGTIINSPNKTDILQTIYPFMKMLPIMPSVGTIIPLYQRYLETDIRYRKKVLGDLDIHPVKDFTGTLFYTWVDNRSFNGDIYSDIMFGPLPKQNPGYVPRILFNAPYRETAEKIARTNEVMLFPELYITEDNIEANTSNIDIFSPKIPADSLIGDVPVKDIADYHILNSQKIMLDNLLYRSAICNMADMNISPSHIIYDCEGHSWEQAMILSARRYMPKAKIIGYDNLTFSRMFTSMFPSTTEFKIKPLPDKIITNGLLYTQILLDNGWPEKLVRTGCAIRHKYLWEKEISRSKPQGPPYNIMVATSIGFDDSVELISKSIEAFNGDNNYNLIIKCHPVINNAVKRYFGDITFDSAPVSELLKKSHVLLYTFTTTCYEALLYGTFPIFIRSENFINLDKLDSVPFIRSSASSPGEIKKVVSDILSANLLNWKPWQAESQEIVRKALSPVTPEYIS
jgi:hypothetical protein